ncbi:MAG TPA: SDR family oxidoreductase [Streptosporangiaceae bacterium]|nr:SDR family oxidoreductase [Streptosporangiaceae bacterium]
MTGAAHGIGQAIAAGLAERGTRIVLGDIDDVSEASDLIGATGHPAVPVTPDVSDPPSTEAARDRATDALGAPTSPRSRGNTTLRTCSTTTPTSSPRRPAGGRTTRVTFPRLGNHPITPALLATDLAAAREFYHGKLGLQIDRKNENAIGFRYGNGTRLDVTQSTVGTADQQIQAAGQVSDIRAEVAELRARGIKVEDCDTPGQRPKTASPTSAPPRPPGSSTQPRTSSAPARYMSSNLARATPRWASRSPTAMLRQPPGRQSSILSRASLVTRFGHLGSAAAGRFGAAW